MNSRIIIFSISIFLFACTENAKDTSAQKSENTLLNVSQSKLKHQTHQGKSIPERFSTPNNYKRIPQEKTSFSYYLRNLKLKPHGTPVQYFDGSTKSNNGIYEAVIDLPIGNKDLHQCADAVMRLQAEYLWQNKRYHDIHFNFTNGHKVEYQEWMKGKRMKIEGNKTSWEQKTTDSNTKDDLWNYLELIFTYAGTSSLEKELIPVKIDEVKSGDVLIKGGFPGHAVILFDEAVNEKTGKKVFLLAQSYMPAQELQILTNPNNEELSPWYELHKGEIITPEWNFTTDQIKRFEN